MTITDIIQILSGFVGAICFGILFNMRGKRLLIASLGGLFSYTLFVVLGLVIESEAIVCFIVSVVISIYCEIMARIIKTPATPMATTALIPLIPGGALYYTMVSVFNGNFEMFLEKAINTVKFATALPLGIIITAMAFYLFIKAPKNSKKQKSQ